MVNKFIKLEEEKGEYLICGYGSGIALGFRGDEDFINRCGNFLYNFGISKKKLLALGLGTIYYACTTYEALRAALCSYYRYQVISNNLIKPERHDVVEGIKFRVFNETELNDKARELGENFINNRLIQNNFMYGISDKGLISSEIA